MFELVLGLCDESRRVTWGVACDASNTLGTGSESFSSVNGTIFSPFRDVAFEAVVVSRRLANRGVCSVDLENPDEFLSVDRARAALSTESSGSSLIRPTKALPTGVGVILAAARPQAVAFSAVATGHFGTDATGGLESESVVVIATVDLWSVVRDPEGSTACLDSWVMFGRTFPATGRLIIRGVNDDDNG